MSEAARVQPGAQRTADYEVVVIGAGQAGLTMGYYLARQGRRFVILEAERFDRDPPGASAGTRYALSRRDGTARCPGCPSRATRTATRTRRGNRLPRAVHRRRSSCRSSSTATCAGSPRGWRPLRPRGRRANDHRRPGRRRDGPFQTPYIPKLAEELDPDVWQAHSTGYRRPSDMPEGTVLVVGGGNTGFRSPRSSRRRTR